MVGRLLALGLTQIDQYTLTKEAIELVDKEFNEVKRKLFEKKNKSFENRSPNKYKKLKFVSKNHINN